MTIAVGDSLPARNVNIDGESVDLAAHVAGKTVVMFGVPAAFSPTCSEAHVPGFVNDADALKAKGVDAIICHSADNHFVMKAWGKDQGVDGKIEMLADWDGSLAKALGTDLDASGGGLGIISHRYAMIIRDGKVAHMAVEASPPDHGVSSSSEVLKAL